MSEKSERLLEALSELNDSTFDAAAEEPPAKKKVRWKRWAALAACLAVVILGAGTFTGVIPLLPIGGSSSGSGGHDEASTFMSYAGPVFPLTLAEENDGITAAREITLDFSPWVPTWLSNEEMVSGRTWLTEAEQRDVLEQYDEWYPEGGRWQTSSDILVTDSYTLTNFSAEDQTVTVLYPFASSLSGLAQRTPALTLDGAGLETDLYIGAYSGGFEGAWGGSLSGENEGSVNLDYAESWEEYQALLAGGTYLQNALGEGPDVSGVPVTVYRFTDPYGPEADDAAGVPNPTLRVGFDLDYDETPALGWGFHMGSYDRENGTMIQGFSIPQPGERGYGEEVYYLVVVGEDVQNMTIGGYVTGGADPDTEPLEGCGVTVERYESDLDTALREILEPYWAERTWEDEYGPTEAPVDFETYYRAFLEYLYAYGMLAPEAMERYGSGWLEGIASDVWSVDRVCWVSAQVTIPAGGSVTLTASMAKEGSYDFYCAHTENQGVYGYDLVTTLGSTLACTAQTAVLADRGQIEIVRQNFGFDLEAGIKTVTLDPETEYYYLEVRRAEGTIPDGPPQG